MSATTENDRAKELISQNDWLTDAQAAALNRVCENWEVVGEVYRDGYDAACLWVGSSDNPKMMMLGIETDGYTHS